MLTQSWEWFVFPSARVERPCNTHISTNQNKNSWSLVNLLALSFRSLCLGLFGLSHSIVTIGYLGLLHGGSELPVLVFQQGENCLALCDLSPRVMYCHFHLILLIICKSLSLVQIQGVGT